MNVIGLVIMKGDEYMMYLHENLKDKALKLVDLKETEDDIKVSMDLGQISIMMSSESNSQEFVQAGTELDQRLRREYPEIQMRCNAANAVPVVVAFALNTTYREDCNAGIFLLRQ